MTTTSTLDRTRNGSEPVEPPPRRWGVDRVESTAGFSVRSLWGLMPVRGRFDDIDGELHDQRVFGPEARLVMKVSSIETGIAKRDEHLRSGDFFDEAKHPLVVFSSASIDPRARGETTIVGVLSARGMDIPVAVTAMIEERGKRLVIDGRATVDRRALGLSSGPLGMIRSTVRLDVHAVLFEAR